MSLTLADIYKARKAIAKCADNTPLIPSPHMRQVVGQEFLMKLENTQPIGAFKIRGALNAIMNLPQDASGVTCCSTGNHGRGVAYAAAQRGLRAVICMSALVPQTKIDGIKALGGEVRIVGQSQDEAQEVSQNLCKTDGLIEISPFDDAHVIAGQGTIGLEIIEARPDIETILVPISGGGLAGGIALAAKSIKPNIQVIAISMDRGAAMYQSMKAGHPIEVKEVASLADSLGGGIGLTNKLSFALCQKLLDDIIVVTEADIYRAMQTLFYEDRIVAEGASVVGIAALQTGKIKNLNGPVATIITGRNPDMKTFTRIVSGQDVQLGSEHIVGAEYAA